MQFKSSKPIGRWSQATTEAGETPADAGPSRPEPDTGTASTAADTGIATDPGQADAATAAEPAGEANSASDASAGAVDAGPTLNEPTAAALRFSVTSRMQHERLAAKDPNFDDDAWGPDLNVGAIWIEDEGGAFVKTLKVWAQSRFEHLIAFNAASALRRRELVELEPDAIDAMTSATLSKHQEHTVRWNLVNRYAERVEPGRYTLWVEVCDYDANEEDARARGIKNETYSIEFDTTLRPQTIRPEDSLFYTAMTLQMP